MIKRILPLFILASPLLAQEAPEPVKEEHPYKNYTYWDFHPLHAGSNFIGFAPANVTDKGGNLTYMKGNAFVTLLVPISETSYFFPRVEYNAFYINWTKNPKFNQKYYTYTQFALTFYSIAIEHWRWISRVEYNIDNAHFNNPSQYGLFSALLWGAYQVHRKWHFHVGAFGYTGFEGDQVYPIIGADFSPNKYWTFMAIFPLDYSVQYNFTQELRLSLKVRPLKERFRTGEHEPQPRSVFSYSSTGVELNFHFEKHLRLELEAYAGYSFGGNFYIKNKDGHLPLYTDVGGAPYGGASLNFGF